MQGKDLAGIKGELKELLMDIRSSMEKSSVLQTVGWMVRCLEEELPFVDIFHPEFSDQKPLACMFGAVWCVSAWSHSNWLSRPMGQLHRAPSSDAVHEGGDTVPVGHNDGAVRVCFGRGATQRFKSPCVRRTIDS